MAATTGISRSPPPVLSDENLGRIADEVARHLDAAAELSALNRRVDVGTAAAHLAWKPQRIYDLVSQGQIPHRRRAGVQFRLGALDRWLDDGGLAGR